MALTHHDEAEFRRIVAGLISQDVPADGVVMTTSELGAREPSLTPVRIAALVGVVIAVALVAVAFSVNVVLGFVVAALSPAVPLGVAVLTDRVRSR